MKGTEFELAVAEFTGEETRRSKMGSGGAEALPFFA